MSGDTVFPFPEPAFLWIHNIVVIPNASLIQTLDERGASTTTLPDEADWPDPVKGYLTAPNETRDVSAHIQRQNIAAVLLLPHSVAIDYMDIVHSSDPQLPPHMMGTYQVETARANISHTRVLLQRYRNQWESVQTP